MIEINDSVRNSFFETSTYISLFLFSSSTNLLTTTNGTNWTYDIIFVEINNVVK